MLLHRANTALQVAKRKRGVAVVWQPALPVLERRRTAVEKSADHTHREEAQS
jgi:hypothetical protein